MAGSLAHVSASDNNVIELDRVRPGRSGRASADRNLCPDLCPDFSESRTPRKVKKSRKKELTPALIDDLRTGKLDDSKTGALSIEVLPSGKKRWIYRRRIARRGVVVKLGLGLYPAYSIADAREWANGLNLQVDAGIDPREMARQELRLATMTVDRAHGLYMEAVREGRSSRAKRINKPRTVADKLDIYRRDIAPKLGRKIIYDVTEADLIKLVEAKGKKARVRANRLAAELKVFFGWTASLRGLEVGLEVDPSRRLGDLRFPEAPRTRRLALQEIGWFLEALVEEEGAADERFDVKRLARFATLVTSPVGTEHWLLSDGRRPIRIDVAQGSLRVGPVLLRYRLAGFAGAQAPLLVLRRLFALWRSGDFSRALHPGEPRAARWILVLRAGDALAAGASQREIAECLLGGEATPRRWRVEASSVRSRAQRLVREARRMAAGSYRELLARGSRPGLRCGR